MTYFSTTRKRDHGRHPIPYLRVIRVFTHRCYPVVRVPPQGDDECVVRVMASGTPLRRSALPLATLNPFMYSILEPMLTAAVGEKIRQPWRRKKVGAHTRELVKLKGAHGWSKSVYLLWRGLCDKSMWSDFCENLPSGIPRNPSSPTEKMQSRLAAKMEPIPDG